MPQNGGYIIWISRAFGNFWSFQEGWWCWSSALIDCCLYVLILVAYLQGAIGAVWKEVDDLNNDNYWILYAARVVCILIITLTNLLGIQIVGVMSVLFAVITLAPFFAMGIFGFDDVIHVLSDASLRKQLLEFWPLTKVHWGLLLAALLWVGSGWDSPGTVAGDVKSPKRTYPNAVYLAVIAVIITNILPVTAAIAAYVGHDLSLKTWDITTNFWADMAYRIGGTQLWLSVEVAAIITSIGLMSLLITSSAWALYALSLPGLLDLPSLTVLHPYWRTPVRCILINTLLLCACALASFSTLLQIAMTLHMASLSLEAAALIWLRIVEPSMKRPYKIPLNASGLVLLFTPQFFINMVLFVCIDLVPIIVVSLTIAAGFVAYFLARLVDRLALPAGEIPESVDLEELFEEIANDGSILHPNETGAEYDASAQQQIPELGSRYATLVDAVGLSETEGLNVHAVGYPSDDDDTDGSTSPIILSKSPAHRRNTSSLPNSSGLLGTYDSSVSSTGASRLRRISQEDVENELDELHEREQQQRASTNKT
jgi:amino acid transporter